MGKNPMASLPRVLIVAIVLDLSVLAERGSSEPYESGTETERSVDESAAGVVEQALRSAESARSMQAAGGRAWPFWSYGKTLHASVPVGPARAEAHPPTAVSSACRNLDVDPF